MSIDDTINDDDAKNYLKKFMLFEMPVLRSFRKHYQKKYGFTVSGAEYWSVIQHAEDLRNWYEQKYSSRLMKYDNTNEFDYE